MKIAILTSGILPIPAVQGGAVENLIDFYLEYNHIHKLHDITIYSTYHPDVIRHPAIYSDVNHYEYINVNSLIAKIRKRLFKWFHKKGYYYYTIEFYLYQVIKKIKHELYDIILIENRPGYILKLSGIKNAKIVYHLHNAKLDNTTPHYQRIYDAATLIICVSDFVLKGILSINSQDNKSIVVQNGIDLKAFRPHRENVMNRSKIGFKEADFIIAYYGKINPEKGIMELIKAMNNLNNFPHIKLLAMGSTFYGANTYNDHPYGIKLLKEAEPIKDRIHFTGFIPYHKIPDYLQLADVAIIPSVWDDPFPTTVLEAQAMGLPIITTRRGGIPEEVTEENAILLETDDKFVDNLAAAILDLYEHPEKRAQMSAASLERSKLFDKETYAKNFFTALEGINKTNQNNTESLQGLNADHHR